MSNAAANKATNTAGSRRRFKLLMMIVVLFMGWAAYIIFGQMQEKDATSVRLATVQEQINASTIETEALKREIERLNDQEYIEQLATKEQGMVKKGEQQIFSD
ncbi:FtsB family cell division protein [Paenibacillus sp. sgz302251]|uniref:FtsB family cell division protein n=1 Tax=Paenibacillus sp. sgz302251 TaxID=3414493 RepID=UPI003C79A1A7